MCRFLFALSLLVASASALQVSPRSGAPKPQMKQVANGLFTASVALAVAASNPVLTHALDFTSPTAVERISTLSADEDLREAQAKFLEERAKMKTQYETQVEGTTLPQPAPACPGLPKPTPACPSLPRPTPPFPTLPHPTPPHPTPLCPPPPPPPPPPPYPSPHTPPHPPTPG